MSVIDVTLTPKELIRINENAWCRNESKVVKRIKDPLALGSLTGLELHELEVTGQYAVSKYLEEPMDWSVKLGGNKTGIHFYASGYSIRVQLATHHPPILKFNRADEFKADVAVLCMMREPTVVAIYGCVSQERFLREHIWQNFGYGKRLTMPSWNLTPIAEFEEEAERGLLKACLA